MDLFIPFLGKYVSRHTLNIVHSYGLCMVMPLPVLSNRCDLSVKAYFLRLVAAAVSCSKCFDYGFMAFTFMSFMVSPAENMIKTAGK